MINGEGVSGGLANGTVNIARVSRSVPQEHKHRTCAPGDLNPHVRRHRHLKPARLPVPPGARNPAILRPSDRSSSCTKSTLVGVRSPAWRNRFLAMGAFYLKGANDADSDLIRRAQAALNA